MASTDFGPEGGIGVSCLWCYVNLKLMVHADFNAVEAVVDATHRYHEMFYEKDQ